MDRRLPNEPFQPHEKHPDVGADVQDAVAIQQADAGSQEDVLSRGELPPQDLEVSSRPKGNDLTIGQLRFTDPTTEMRRLSLSWERGT